MSIPVVKVANPLVDLPSSQTYTIPLGIESKQIKVHNANTVTNNALLWSNITSGGLNIGIHRLVRFRISCRLTATTNGAPNLPNPQGTFNNFGLRQNPLNSAGTITLTLNSSKLDFDMTETAHALMRFNDSESLKYRVDASMSDFSYNNDDVVLYNPFSSVGNSVVGSSRALALWSEVVDGGYNVTFDDFILVSPFLFDKGASPFCFFNIKDIDVSIKINDPFDFFEGRAWTAFQGGNVANVYQLDITNADIILTHVGQPLQAVPPVLTYRYVDIKTIRNNVLGTNQQLVNAPEVIYTNNQTLNKIPNMLAIYARPLKPTNPKERVYLSDHFLKINRITISLGNEPVQFADYTRRDLQDVSIRNGICMNRDMFDQIGDVLLLKFGTDIILPSGLVVNQQCNINLTCMVEVQAVNLLTAGGGDVPNLRNTRYILYLVPLTDCLMGVSYNRVDIVESIVDLQTATTAQVVSGKSAEGRYFYGGAWSWSDVYNRVKPYLTGAKNVARTVGKYSGMVSHPFAQGISNVGYAVGDLLESTGAGIRPIGGAMLTKRGLVDRLS